MTEGFDTIWLAEASPRWRKHQMEARSSTALSALHGTYSTYGCPPLEGESQAAGAGAAAAESMA